MNYDNQIEKMYHPENFQPEPEEDEEKDYVYGIDDGEPPYGKT